MKNLVLAILLATGLANAGCSAFTPSEVQSGVATANQDLAAIRSAVAWITSQHALSAKILRNIDAVAANVSAMDTLLNK